MKKYIGLIVRDFSIILSSTIVFSTVYIYMFSIETILPSLLWQLIATSFIAALFDMIFYLGRLERMPFLLKMAIHFILMFALFIFAGYGWFNIRDMRLLGFFGIFILVGYATIFALVYSYESRQAKLMNKKLSEYKHMRSESK